MLSLATLATLAVVPTPARAQAPQVQDVEDSLIHDPSYKVRVDAALVLGKLRQNHSIPALIVATKDPHPAVRKMAGWFIPGGARYERLKPRVTR